MSSLNRYRHGVSSGKPCNNYCQLGWLDRLWEMYLVPRRKHTYPVFDSGVGCYTVRLRFGVTMMKTPVQPAENMNSDPRVKLIKKKKSRVPRIPPQVQSLAVENKWSTAIQSWVSEFQKRRVESLRGFNSLFK